MKWFLIAFMLLYPIAASGGDIVSKDTIFETVSEDGTLYSVKSTSARGTYFWYEGGMRCVAKLAKKTLNVNCAETTYVFHEDSGDVFIRLNGAPAIVLQDAAIGNGMYKSIKRHAAMK
ncbi:hypothetical protein [Oryzomonas rubra]|uniref:Uncharacterized protein n=1 Tax=Oryzomonas rubra TaxID=2509454 RepID=A0A5A9XAS3_9BACT|nr:hypothetical protein [Oryzomonas rubra]KAA0888771.1 hypothetical protein ET418_15435 [Oryzomonas rubra]